MKIIVQLEPGEVVEDWSWFRDEFEQAADRLGLTITQIVNSRHEELV